MTFVSDQIRDAVELYALADNIRNEADCWHERHIRRALKRAAKQLDEAARETLHQPHIYAEAWLDAGARYLDAHVLHRRFLEALSPLGRRVRRPLVTLECRDGSHGSCFVCDCQCHRWSA